MKDLSSSVHKTFAILEYFNVDKQEWGVTELAKAIGSNKSTIYRFLSDLQQLGILQKHPVTDKYSLGLKLYELGCRVPLRAAFVDKVHPALRTVAEDIAETVHLAVFKNHQVFYIDKVESPQGLRISSQIGSYNPAYATSLGKVLLAHMDEEHRAEELSYIMDAQAPVAYTQNTITCRKQLEQALDQIKQKGYALDREEFEIGLICVGIPVYNQNNEIVASLSSAGPASRFKEEQLSRYIEILQRGADKIKQTIDNFKP